MPYLLGRIRGKELQVAPLLAKATVIALLGLLCLGCRWGDGLRSDTSNRFAPTPPGAPFQECEMPGPKIPEDIEVGTGRRIAAADWVPGAGGVVVTSDESSRFADQALFLVSRAGSLKPLVLPSFLEPPINEVHLLARSQPLLVIGEYGPTGVDVKQLLLEEVLSAPKYGDLVVMDLAGVQRQRYRSAHSAVPSPDARWLAYWRSDDDGLHNLFVTRPEQDSVAFVAAITESDPGSGMSFSACWSQDSRYLHISGGAWGLSHFSWAYDVNAQELYAKAGASDVQQPDSGTEETSFLGQRRATTPLSQTD